MDQKELNKRTMELLQKKLDEKPNCSLIIAIVADLDAMTYSQIVGYGVTMPIIADAFGDAWGNLQREVLNKNKS
jgi:hypothetical protein